MNSIENFVNVIKQCESASGNGTKDTIKKAIQEMDAGCRTLVKYAMDPFLVFGVKKYDEPTSYSNTNKLDVSDITGLLDKLVARNLTGNAARNAVTELLSNFTQDTAQYIARIIGKDLQAGFSADTYNKVWKNDPVRVFDVMLADKCETEEDFADITFPCLGDVKYDGARHIMMVAAFAKITLEDGSTKLLHVDDEVELVDGTRVQAKFLASDSKVLHATNIEFQYEFDHRSRAGKPATHYAGVFEDDLLAIRNYLGYDFVIDGECMGRDYIDTMNAKKGSNADAKSRLVFKAFFIMPLTDWMNQSCPITMEENRSNLEKIIKECNCQKIILSDAIIINDYAHMIQHLDVVTAPGYDGMPNGQEGLILKRLNATYRWDRSLDWCKVKKFFDADARIVSWEFGKKRLANTMGRVNTVGFLEDGTRFEVAVGSGWTDEMRKDVVENWETKWKDATITLKYQEVSKSKNKEFCSLRFPTFFRGPRDDKFIEI